MAQARAVIDIVGSKARAYEFLEQIRFFVRSLGRSEPGERLRSVLVAELGQSGCRSVERFVPTRFAEMGQRIRRVDLVSGFAGGTVFANKRLGQSVRVAHIVEPEAALDAQSPVVGRAALTPGHGENLVVLDAVGDLAADAAIGADAIDLFVGLDLTDFVAGHKRTGRARLDALAAGDAG